METLRSLKALHEERLEKTRKANEAIARLIETRDSF